MGANSILFLCNLLGAFRLKTLAIYLLKPESRNQN
jgi:hypothetical protein